MKVSSGVGFHSGVSRNRTSASPSRSWDLNVGDGERLRARERSVVGEVLGKLLVDLGNTRVDLGKPRHVGGLGLFVAFVGRLRYGGAARRVPRLPFAHQVLPLADDRSRDWRLPVAPRAAICANDAAASELCAHCAVSNISAASPGSGRVLLPRGDGRP